MALIEKYGAFWDEFTHPLAIEFRCIVKGGKWVRPKGEEAGKGLFFHYKKAIEIIWPDFIQHRWFNTTLEEYLAHEWIGIAGPKDAGKTGGLSVILLADYYPFSTCTSIILSSTTMKALKNRVFGEFTMRHRAARKRIEWLPGHMIESECRIVTDERDENVDGRDVRNGVIGIPVKDGKNNALDDIIGIKNKRKRWMIDELQTLPASALDGTANFMQNNADCKVIGSGNPSSMDDAHGKLCQPSNSIGGWDGGIDQQGGTKVWPTTFDNGVCIQLPGSDCPNMDVAPELPVPFPFLMTRDRMEKDGRTWGKTDWHFMMFNEGRWPRGQAASRVITKQMCVNGHALEEARWAGPKRIKIGCMDAGFGGDRCIFHELHFGREMWMPEHPGEIKVNGFVTQEPLENDDRQIIALIDTQVVPIEGSEVKGAEDQIVLWAKKECEKRDILPANFFYEAGMRTSLVQKFPQLWSDKPVSIDFGGKPSEGKVSQDIDVECREYYFNFVTELWYTVRLVIESQQFRQLTEETMREGCMREYKRVGANKLQVETKKEFKEKAGFSPDLFDALVTGIAGAKMRGFTIRRIKAIKSQEDDDRWKRELEEKSKKYWSAGQLSYA